MAAESAAQGLPKRESNLRHLGDATEERTPHDFKFDAELPRSLIVKQEGEQKQARLPGVEAAGKVGEGEQVDLQPLQLDFRGRALLLEPDQWAKSANSKRRCPSPVGASAMLSAREKAEVVRRPITTSRGRPGRLEPPSGAVDRAKDLR